MTPKFWKLLVVLTLCFGVPGGLSGCAGYDVQLEGKIFEAAGLSGTVQQEEPKLKERAGLVLPPEKQLPAPGKRAAVPEGMQWPDDPDLKARRVAQATEAERKKYCSGPGRNENHPFYDEDKAKHCTGLISNSLQNAFGRAPEPEQE